jgi:hypothetical protein
MAFFKKVIYILTAFIKFIFYKPKAIEQSKQVYFNISDPRIYNRYLYTLVKAFLIEGYTVVFPKTFNQFRFLHHPKEYLGLLGNEVQVVFKTITKSFNGIEINSTNLTADYFSKIETSHENSAFYYVPIAQHPLMYHRQLWNSNINYVPRKTSIFMIGNFDSLGYERIKHTSPNIISRIAIYNFLNDKNLLTSYSKPHEFQAFLTSNEDHKCILIKREDFSLPMQELRPTFSKFHFFLACPGYVMALCHNINEAMSVGTIPILQRDYANLFVPKLKHEVNAIIFDNLDDLAQKIKNSYNYTYTKLDEMHNNVFYYYESYLTPKKVVESIEKNHPNTIYLLAEGHSVALKNNKASN